MEERNKRVVVFGIFDGVHEGHRSLFRQAREYGNELIAIVGRDKICEQLKQKTPKHNEQERLALVKAEPVIDEAVLGDETLSTYRIVTDVRPDVICLGYDQKALQEDISSWVKGKNIKIVVAAPFKPDTYKSSLL